jgi:hypothetical protein
MVHLYLVPAWFLGYDIVLQVIFALITLAVGIFALRISKISSQRSVKLFGISFLLISIAYFIKAFLNFMIMSRLNENISLALKVISVNVLNLIALNIHVVLFSIGLITLAYMTFRVKSAKIYTLSLILVLVAIFFAADTLTVYYIISSILLIYIFLHYLINYLNKKKINTLLVMIAFALLLFGNIHFIFSLENSTIYYVIGHFLELSAYTLILINLILVRKNEQKTRQASNRT